MNLSEPFIRRPIATMLLMAAVAFVGIAAFPFLPVAPLPQVDFPTIQVTATWQGASAETMATSVAAPLERQFAQIPGVSQLTSLSALGATTIVIQFDLSRNIDSAAQDVQAAITVAGKTLPQTLTAPPSYKKVNPADSPMLLLSLRSDTIPLTTVDDYADVPRPTDFAGARCRTSVDFRRPDTIDPYSGRPGETRLQRRHLGGNPHRARQLDNEYRQGHDQHLNEKFHHRDQRPDRRGRAVQRCDPRLPERCPDPGSRCRSCRIRSRGSQRRGLSKQQGRDHSGRLQTTRRERR